MQSPVVSVVMAVFNDAEYLHESVPSILAQTLKDLEFIVVDDGSTDDSLGVLQGYAEQDSRVRIIRNEENMGLASSLNRGIAAARGQYVARMDADDICLPQRLDKQFKFMEQNKDISMCGASAKLFGFRRGWWVIPACHEQIRASLLFFNPICHPSVMYRASSLPRQGELYESGRRRAEDLELWSRLVEEVRVANLQERLIMYRLHDPKSLAKREAVVSHGNEIRHSLLTRLMGELTEPQFQLHMKLVRCERNQDLDFLDEAADWLEQILQVNEVSRFYDQAALGRVVSYRWWRVCRASSELGPKASEVFHSRPRLTHVDKPLVRYFALWAKCFLRYKNSATSIHDSELSFVYKLPETS